MTREEHEARAMLLGMNLNYNGGYYVSFDRSTPFTRLDANTLEPITDQDEVHRRQRYKFGDYKYD